MNSMEYQRGRKVDAERQRREQINVRLEQLRRLLKPDKPLTRIQVLREATNKMEAMLLKSPESHALAHIHIRPESVPADCRTSLETGVTKAIVEQHRRQMERHELNRVRVALGIQKISDVCLLDQMIDWLNRMQSENVVPSSDRTSQPQLFPTKRNPLQMLNLNIESKWSRSARNIQTAFDVSGCSIHSKSANQSEYWRPWEVDNT
ncbi:hypothetical protein CSKR_102144 [Clonorchis sinensis]|uniref:Uncharacterized protein n=1 Tax=Clonorchis sinensis TaxID=79923 RepID=A0A3R7GQB8_CLOSI|nr:hypothetical protein CSKR_102144 [Clonorchis sinensis]